MTRRRFLLAAIVGLATGLLLIIIIPSWLTAIDRSRQKHTMKGARDWAVALERAAHRYPLSRLGTSAELSAQFAKPLPRTDGWGNPYRIQLARGSAMVTSAGRDGIFERQPHGGATISFDNDIVIVDGTFTQFPEGI